MTDKENILNSIVETYEITDEAMITVLSEKIDDILEGKSLDGGRLTKAATMSSRQTSRHSKVVARFDGKITSNKRGARFIKKLKNMQARQT